MRKTVISFILSLFVSLGMVSAAVADGHAQKEHLYVTVTSDDINHVGMMVTLARAALVTKRASTIILGADGYRNALKAGDQEVFVGRDPVPGANMTPRQLLQAYMAAGGKVMVCGLCLKLNNLTAKDLIDGVEIANGRMVVDAFFAQPNARVVGF